MLRLVLLLRAIVNLVSAWVFLVPSHSDWFVQSGVYAIVDGFIGVVSGLLLNKDPRGRWASTLATVDGLFRLCLGGVIVYAHEFISAFVITSVLFLAVVCAACLSLGLLGIAYISLHARAGRAGPLPSVLATVALVLFALGLGSGLFPNSADHRQLLGVYVLTFGITMLLAVRGWDLGTR